MVCLVPISRKSAPAASTSRGFVHDVLVRYVRVGKDHLGDLVFVDELQQALFRIDGNAFRIELAGQLWWVQPPFDVWDLGGRKGHHFISLATAKERIKVVKVAPSGAHDQYASTCHDTPSLLDEVFVVIRYRIIRAHGGWCAPSFQTCCQAQAIFGQELRLSSTG